MYVEYTVTQLHADSASLRRTASMNESSTAGAATGSMIRAHSAHLGLPSSFPGVFLEGEAVAVAAGVVATKGASR